MSISLVFFNRFWQLLRWFMQQFMYFRVAVEWIVHTIRYEKCNFFKLISTYFIVVIKSSVNQMRSFGLLDDFDCIAKNTIRILKFFIFVTICNDWTTPTRKSSPYIRKSIFYTEITVIFLHVNVIPQAYNWFFDSYDLQTF